MRSGCRYFTFVWQKFWHSVLYILHFTKLYFTLKHLSHLYFTFWVTKVLRASCTISWAHLGQSGAQQRLNILVGHFSCCATVKEEDVEIGGCGRIGCCHKKLLRSVSGWTRCFLLTVFLSNLHCKPEIFLLWQQLSIGRPITRQTFWSDQSEGRTCGGQNSVDMKAQDIQPWCARTAGVHRVQIRLRNFSEKF